MNWRSFFGNEDRRKRFLTWAEHKALNEEEYKRKVSRIGRMLVGKVSTADEGKLFEFLWDIEATVLIDKED